MQDLKKENLINEYSLINDEINLKEFFKALWDGKIIIIFITTIFAISSVFYALSLTNYYQSESLLMLRDQSSDMSQASQYGGIAAMAGINLSSGSGDKAEEAIAMIKSRAFLKHLLTFEDVLPSIMATKNYDSKTGEIEFDSDLYNASSKEWLSSEDLEGRPSYLKAYAKYNGGLLSVSKSDSTGFVSIKIEHPSPVFAKEFLDLVVREVNSSLRQKDLERSSRALEYLTSELSKVSLKEIKMSINNLIETELKTTMFARLNEDYVFSIIEPAFIPEVRSKPSRSAIVIMGTMLGGLLSLFIVLARYFLFTPGRIDQH